MVRRIPFPTTLMGAVRYFADEAVCVDFLATLRWPEGVRCAFCDSDRIGHVATRKLWRCKDCRKSFGVKKGTIFEDSPIPLSKWLPALWLFSAGKKGRSSHQLALDLGVTQKTAWFMGHRIRLAMETEGFNRRRLSGEVAADETFIGGLERNKHAAKRQHLGRGRVGKATVSGIMQRDGEVRTMVVPNRRRRAIHAEILTNVAPGSVVYSDALRPYEGLSRDFVHEVIDHSKSYVDGRLPTNGIENLWSLFKRVLYGTHHSVDAVHLDRYLTEIVHRLKYARPL